MVAPQGFHGWSMVDSRWVHGATVVALWWVHGESMVGPRWVHGSVVDVGPWCFHGGSIGFMVP